MSSNLFPAARRWLVAGLLAAVLVSRARAQSAPEQRWLFIFDTSAAMKQRLPGVEAEVRNILASAVSEQLQAGDTLGVWTFGKELHTGQFPLVTWDPDQAAMTASNLISFVRKQTYGNDTTWSALQPLLGQVIRTSPRLTIVVFCDGLGKVDWTPYNDGINETFSHSLAERKKMRQPLVLLVRTQRGQFTGCTVNFPPGALNIPPFPPLPEPVKMIPANLPPVAAPPPVVVPSLFIAGTNAGTNISVLTKNVPPPVTNAPATNAPVVAVEATNVLAASNRAAVMPGPPPLAPEGKIGEAKNILPATNDLARAPTNAVPAAAASDPDHGARTLNFISAGLFAAAVGLTIYLWARAGRRPRGSLITSSMQNDPRPPPRK
jgi:hypothetical protein